MASAPVLEPGLGGHGRDMMYLSPLTRRMMERRHPRIGAIVTPDSHRILPDWITWAADNGCYAQGDRFDLARYLRWLERPEWSRERCLFAVAPDVVGDAQATWARSAPVLPQLRQRGYRAALVAQDGFDPGATDWAAFDVLFIGGTTKWKCSEAAFSAIAAARARGQWVHVGRVNGEARLRAFAAAGAQSADGTGLVFAPDALWPRVTAWLTRLEGQVSLDEASR